MVKKMFRGMSLKTVFAAALILAMSFVFVACSGDDDDHPLIGTWVSAEFGDAFRFTATEIFWTESITTPVWHLMGTYTISGQMLTVTIPGEVAPQLAHFTITGSLLVFTWPGEEPETFTRQ